MSTFFLVISAICFISAFGVHMRGCNSNSIDGWCPYMEVPWMNSIPWISGFILAVIPEYYLFDVSWLLAFVINIPIVTIFGPLFTHIVMVRFASGKGTGYDVLISIILALVTMVIGLLLR